MYTHVRLDSGGFISIEPRFGFIIRFDHQTLLPCPPAIDRKLRTIDHFQASQYTFRVSVFSKPERFWFPVGITNAPEGDQMASTAQQTFEPGIINPISDRADKETINFGRSRPGR